MLVIGLLCVVLLATWAGVFAHEIAADWAGSYDKDYHDYRRRNGLGPFASPNARQREFSAGGYTHTTVDTEYGGEASTHTYVFDEHGRLAFNAKANLITSVMTTNVVGVGLFLAAYCAYYYPSNFRAAAGVAEPSADFRFLPEACAWRRKFDFAREIESRTPTSFLRETWQNGALRSIEPLVNGERHGLAHYAFADGRPYGDILWSHGLKHGVFTLYRQDGSREMTLSYRNGVPFGWSEWFDPSGSVTAAWVYLDAEAWVAPARCGEAAKGPSGDGEAGR